MRACRLELVWNSHATCACVSRGGDCAYRWLIQSGLEIPVRLILADIAPRRASPAPVASARLHGEAAGGACQERRRRAPCGHGGGEGVVLEEAEEDDDVAVTVDDGDEEAQVDDLEEAHLWRCGVTQ